MLVRVGETRAQGTMGHQNCRRPVPERAQQQRPVAGVGRGLAATGSGLAGVGGGRRRPEVGRPSLRQRATLRSIQVETTEFLGGHTSFFSPRTSYFLFFSPCAFFTSRFYLEFFWTSLLTLFVLLSSRVPLLTFFDVLSYFSFFFDFAFRASLCTKRAH